MIVLRIIQGTAFGIISTAITSVVIDVILQAAAARGWATIR